MFKAGIRMADEGEQMEPQRDIYSYIHTNPI